MLSAAVFSAADREGARVIGLHRHDGAAFDTGDQVFLHAPFREPERVLDTDVVGVGIVGRLGVHGEHDVFITRDDHVFTKGR